MGFSVSLAATRRVAEIGVSAAQPKSFAVGAKMTTKADQKSNKIEDFWANTNIQRVDLQKLVNEKVCHKNQKVFLACVNSVLTALKKTNLRLQLDGNVYQNVQSSKKLDNYSEKQNLSLFVNLYSEELASRFDFNKIWDQVLQMNSESDHKYLIASGINGYLSIAVDPHTYISPTHFFRQVAASNERSKYFLGLSFEKREGRIFIRKVFKNSDADWAGLMNNDEVLSIGGQKLNDMSLAEVSTILKDQSQKTFPFVVKRNKLTFLKKLNRTYRVLSQVQSEVLDNGNRIGYIQLSKFAYDICDNVRSEIEKMNPSSLKGLVLDLRDNPGGLLTEASCLAGLFLGEGKKVFSVKYLGSNEEEVALTTSEQIYFGPMVILTNNSSASASEIIAGAMQEYNRATIIGERTFGKGSFQEIDMWNEDTDISLFQTQGFYLLPSGESTQLKGVEPDLILDDENKVVSEGELYQFPLEYKGTLKSSLESAKTHKKTNHEQLCGGVFNINTSGDKFIAHAQQVLGCQVELSAKAEARSENINL